MSSAGSGMSVVTKKTTRLTPNKVGMAQSVRRSAYRSIEESDYRTPASAREPGGCHGVWFERRSGPMPALDDLLARAERWADDDPDPGTQAELRALLQAPDLAATDLADRFDGSLAFGTAGLR